VSDDTRVRQQPFTAMEAPSSLPSSTVDAEMRNRGPRREMTCPSSSTIPVNMAKGYPSQVGGVVSIP